MSPIPRRYRREQYSVSDVVSVDGIPVVECLEQLSSAIVMQDPGAEYNTLFGTPQQFAAVTGGPRFVLGGCVNLPDASTFAFSDVSGDSDSCLEHRVGDGIGHLLRRLSPLPRRRRATVWARSRRAMTPRCRCRSRCLFAVEDVIIVWDGACSSACGLFVAARTRQAGARPPCPCRR